MNVGIRINIGHVVVKSIDRTPKRYRANRGRQHAGEDSSSEDSSADPRITELLSSGGRTE